MARVQETASLAELLPLIRSGQPLLVVVDEHGGTEGLVTVADLTGEIVGDEDDDLEGATIFSNCRTTAGWWPASWKSSS